MAEAEALSSLQAMFPEADVASLQAILSMFDGDVAQATNLLLGEAAAGGGAAALVGAGAGGNDEAEEEEEDEAEAEEEADDDDDDDDDDDGEDEDEEEEVAPPPKRLKVVEASDPAAQAGSKVSIARFDGQLLTKTHLELLNLMPSKLSHTTITLWSEDIKSQPAALAQLASESGGWWVCHFPTSEVDHVWRLLLNSHLKSKAFGPVVHLSSSSFAPAGNSGEFEVRALVRDADDVHDLKRIGASLLSVAPASTTRAHVLFLRGGFKEDRATSKTKLEEKSEYKLVREKRSDKEREAVATSLGKRPGHLFDPDRVIYQLFTIEKSGSVNWVKVPA